MCSFRRLLKFAIRVGGWTIPVFSGVLFLFLAGYWLGWKATPAATEIKVSVDSSAEVEQTPSKSHRRQRRPAAGPGREEVRENMARLARLMISDSLHARAEIIAFTLDEVQSALAALEDAPVTGPFTDLRLRLLERWASLDPRAAFDYARSLASNSGNSSLEASASVLRRWAISSPTAALQAWRELGMTESNRDRYDRYRSDFHGLSDIFSRLGSQDLNQAFTEIQNLLPDQQAVAWKALAGLAGEEPQRDLLLSAIAALAPGEARTGGLAEALTAWMRTGKGAESLEQWLDSAHLSRADYIRIEDRMATSEFFGGSRQAAADWLIARAQTPAERANRLETTVRNWAYEDPVASGKWLIAQGLDETAALAMAAYARTVAGNHPAEAVTWARSIPGEAVRQRALEEVEKRIRQFHPDRADALLATPQSSH